eukprot:633383-Amphidinium_carterae.1
MGKRSARLRKDVQEGLGRGNQDWRPCVLGPGEFKVSEHLFLFADKLQTYADARKVVFEFLDAHRAQTASAAVPMDVDALTQKGGKGKDGKGRKHGGQEGRKYGSPDANSNKANKDKFAGECWICGKTGHRSSDCWYKEKKGKDGGKGGKKGKGNGKGKAAGSLEEPTEEPKPADAGHLELSAVTTPSSSSPSPLNTHLQEGWLRVNFDTGAAAS